MVDLQCSTYTAGICVSLRKWMSVTRWGDVTENTWHNVTLHITREITNESRLFALAGAGNHSNQRILAAIPAIKDTRQRASPVLYSTVMRPTIA